MMRPTLFVGLGTTGTKILKSLRDLMAEEYTYGGLPIFRYISVETDGDFDLENKGQMEDYERIMAVRATINNTAPIQQHKLTPGDPLYNPHLAEWLNPELLKMPFFKAGAANIRMAGRLCLWENWADMQNTLVNAHGAVIAPGAMTATLNMLKKPVDGGILGDGGGIHVYIVGSLCGGSCSGMLVDVAYFFKTLIGGGNTNRVYGIFTMYDAALAAPGAASNAVRAANCYAALRELNYYNFPETTYDVITPSGLPVNNPGQPPFDYTMFVSRSGKIPVHKFVLPNGGFDEDSLNLMVALNLFTEAAGNTDEMKEAIRVNFKGIPGFGELKPVPAGQLATMMRSFASFGLTAVWYPKYRISSAAACLVSQKLCKNWLGTHVPEDGIAADAKKEWDTTLKGNIDALTSPVGQPSLKGQIDSLLSRARQEFSQPNTKAQQLARRMPAFPEGTGESFREKFSEGGQYFALMEMRQDVCRQQFLGAIERTLNSQLAKIDFQGTYGLADVQAFFEKFDKEIEKTLEACPVSPPSLNLGLLNFAPMRHAENNRWTKLIGLQAQSIEAHRKALIDTYCQSISGDRNSIYGSLRNYFLRPVLQEVREKLGFGVLPEKVDGPKPPPTIKQRLDRIADNLNGCVGQFAARYISHIEDAPKSQCVKIVTKNPDNQIGTDAEELHHEIYGRATQSALFGNQTMGEFLERESDEITGHMEETYRRLALERIQVETVVTKVQQLLGADGNSIQPLVSRSNPYQTFCQAYAYNADLVDPPPNIIFGHDPTENARTLRDLATKLSSPTLEFRWDGSSVDHLLFFYQEEAGFAFDDLDSYETLKQHFDASPGPYGHFTHQNPSQFDLELRPRSDRLARWCKALGVLVPAICNHIDSEAFSRVFRLRFGKYVFEYDVDGMTQILGLSDDPEGIKRLSRNENVPAYDDFIKRVQFKFAQLGRETVNGVINHLLEDVADLVVYNELSEFYDRFLDEVYPDGGVAPPKTTDTVEAHLRPVQQTYGIPPRTEPAAAAASPPVPPNPVGGNTMANTNASVEGYVEHSSEEAEHVSGAFAEAESENVQQHAAVSTGITGSNTAEDESVWAEGEPGTESGQTSEPPEAVADDDSQSEQPPESAQEKQAAPPKPFSVADVDIKRLK